MLEVIRKEIRETNDNYDPEKCHDGGGYSQPEITVVFETGCLHITDESCGDFGSRIYVTYADADGNQAYAAYGSMLGENEFCSEFTFKQHEELLTWIYNELGYLVPTESEVKEYWENKNNWKDWNEIKEEEEEYHG